MTSAGAGVRPKLLFLLTEDWYFWSHRLPVARAARDAGFEVVVATRVQAHGERIRGEGFRLCPLGWRRRGDGLTGAARAIAEIARLYRAERPDIGHHVALKPVLFGALAARLAFPGGTGAPARLSAIMGLGGGLAARGALARMERRLLGGALRLAAGGGHVVVQNPEDGAALTRFGVDRTRIALIRGSGVDTAHFQPLPEPTGEPIAIAFVGRMLRSKGVLDAVAALRKLRERGLAVELLLAGSSDDNRDSLSEAELRALGDEPGITRLGRVEDVRIVWQRAAMASASGETGLLVPPHDVDALAEAIAALAADPARRRGMGEAGRALVEHDFAAPLIAEQTLALYRDLLRARADRR
ncbi:MAG: glycosyltransferase family 4 protein [Alphaproteobacteria bacterium]|nr:MAG: glycosyltransferase family 4 protein [Alphaproteobacteria bacterium]